MRVPRQEKIERLKRTEAFKEKLKNLRQKKQQSINLTATDISNTDEEPVSEYDRSLLLTMLQLMVLDALGHLRMAKEELPFLQMRLEREKLASQGKGDNRQQQSHNNNNNRQHNNSGSSSSNGNGNGRREQGQQQQQEQHKPFVYKVTRENMHQPLPDRVRQHIKVAPPKMNAVVNTVGMTTATSVEEIIKHHTQNRERVFTNSNTHTYTPEQWADIEIAQGILPVRQQEKVFEPIRKQNNGYVLSHDERLARDMFVKHMDAKEAGEDPAVDPCCEDEGHDHEQNMEVEEAKRQKDSAWANYSDENYKGEGARYETHSLYNQDKRFGASSDTL
jgi:hypothetical protein